jgi:Fe-S cluster assembly iron-binding protein IscA
MLTLTTAASEYLNGILTNEQTPDDAAVRIVAEQQGLAMKLDTPRPGDATFDHEGRTVLLLDESVKQLLGDSTLDVEATATGTTLAIRPAEGESGGDEAAGV